MKSGVNGLVLLVTLLAWWGQALADRSPYQVDTTAEWENTMSDVTKCFTAITSTTNNVKKQKLMTPKESKSKWSV